MMPINLKPETEARLHELEAKTGRPAEDLVEDAMAGYLEELSQVRSMLDRRYDAVATGQVKPIDGEEAFDRLRRRSQEIRKQRS